MCNCNLKKETNVDLFAFRYFISKYFVLFYSSSYDDLSFLIVFLDFIVHFNLPRNQNGCHQVVSTTVCVTAVMVQMSGQVPWYQSATVLQVTSKDLFPLYLKSYSEYCHNF